MWMQLGVLTVALLAQALFTVRDPSPSRTDMLDGMIARSSGRASEAGEVLDAAVDRVHYSLLVAVLLVAVLANATAIRRFKVLYATLKASERSSS